MNSAASFELPKWIEGHKDGISVNLAGSAAPPLTIAEIITVSNDPEITARKLDLSNLKIGLGNSEGEIELRERVAALYERQVVGADDVLIASGTTGANMTALESLLSPGDHVVCAYPSYAPLFNIPKALGCDVSFWRLDFANDWQGKVEDLAGLLRPQTKMIMLNNPNNPTGTILTTNAFEQIVDLARQRDITVFADEIFRPMFHGETAGDAAPKSLVELSERGYEKLIVTGSMSKAYGLSGTRIGWIVTKHKAFRRKMIDMSLYSLMAVSTVDSAIAKEALSERCRPAILDRHLGLARVNISAFEDFMKRHSDTLSWIKPMGGNTAFVLFRDALTGTAVDDVKLCHALRQESHLLLSPGSLCFSEVNTDFKGFVRMHLTMDSNVFHRGLELLESFLLENGARR